MGSLEARSVWARVGSFLLKGVDLRVRSGEVVAVVGVSGSGKSTLGRVLCGLLRPLEGEVLLDGRPLPEPRWGRVHPVQMIYQDPYSSLPPHREVLDLALEMFLSRGLDRGEALDRALALGREVGLELRALFGLKAPNLSGGQRQRLALLRALSLDPPFLVADEPLSMLDVGLRAGVLRALLRSCRSRGIGLLYITHDLGEARFADRIVAVWDGMVVEEGEAREVLSRPLHPYVRLLSRVFASPLDEEVKEGAILGIIKGGRGPSGCPFGLVEGCEACALGDPPPLREVYPGRFARCQFIRAPSY